MCESESLRISAPLLRVLHAIAPLVRRIFGMLIPDLLSPELVLGKFLGAGDSAARSQCRFLGKSPMESAIPGDETFFYV